MKNALFFPIFLLLCCMNFNLIAQGSGETIFKSTCAACHTINGGRLVGPDLSGVYQIRDNEWLIKFTRSSQTLIKSGDTAAIAIFEEYNKIPMPDNNLSDEQILSVIDYIKNMDQSSVATTEKTETTDTTGTKTTESVMPPDSLYTEELVQEGRALYNGYTQFENGGAACNACHFINDPPNMGGGTLALNLSDSYTKLGPAGLKAIIANPPFPVMKVAMLNHDLTENEIQPIIALLKSVGERKYEYSRPGAAILFFSMMGLLFAILVFVILTLVYDTRKIP